MLTTSPLRRRRNPRHGGPDASPEVFGDGLRHDLASKRIVAFESPVGGGVKRAFDLTIALVSAPFWFCTLIVMMLPLKRKLVLSRQECIGYGGRCFMFWSFRPKAQSSSAEVVPLNERVQASQVQQDQTRDGFFEALPGMINVLRGEMSLIGPKPLQRPDFDALRGLRKNYASARPGLIDVYRAINAAEARLSPYGSFSIRWTLSQDLTIADDAFQRLRARLKARRTR